MKATLLFQPASEAPVQLGDRLPAVLRFVLPEDARLGPPRVLAPQDDLAVVDVGPSRPATDPTVPPGTREVPLVIVPFRTGAVDHPGLVVPWVDTQGHEGELATGPIRLQVEAQVTEGALGRPDDIRGPYGGLVAPIGPWLAGGAVVALAVIALLLWWRRRSRRPRTPVPALPFGGMTPEAWAGRQVDDLVLRLEGLDPTQRAVRLHLELAPILRAYLMGRFGIPAPERTTTEVVALLGSRDPEFARDLARMLTRCDGVKFARIQPPASSTEEILALARALLRRTAPEGTS